MFYWPAIDLTLWGLTGKYFISLSENSLPVLTAIVYGILLWIVPWRAQSEISTGVLAEFWDKNLPNIFVSPLKFSEWIVSLILMGIIKGSISIAFASLIAFLLYQVNFYQYGAYFLPFLFLLIMTGWWLGFIVAAIVLRYGSKVQTFAWTVTWAIAPFSAIYFPVSILPKWAQTIAYLLPSSYVFEGAREVIYKHTLNWNLLLISFLLNIVYLSISIFLFWLSYKKAFKRGLQSVS
jgi:ABC-2 type transport system permease protein